MEASWETLGSRSRVSSRRLKSIHILVLLAGVVAIGYLVLGLPLVRQSGEQEMLEADIAIVRRAMSSASTTESIDDLQTTLETARANLVAVEGAFPTIVDSTTFIADTLYLAERYQVRVLSMVNAPASKRVIGEHKYVLTPFSMSLAGRRVDLVGFLGALEKAPQQTLVVRMAQLSGTQDGDRLAIDLDIYTRAADDQAAPGKP